MSCEYTFDIPAFRVSYPAYANPITYPDATLQMYFNNGTSYIANCNYGYLNGVNRYQALTLMTAHLTYISDLISAGQTPVLIQNSTIDKITVGLTPPPLLNQFQWWLSTSPYGQQLLALLQINSCGGFFVGGSPVRASFGFSGVY